MPYTTTIRNLQTGHPYVQVPESRYVKYLYLYTLGQVHFEFFCKCLYITHCESLGPCIEVWLEFTLGSLRAECLLLADTMLVGGPRKGETWPIDLPAANCEVADRVNWMFPKLGGNP